MMMILSGKGPNSRDTMRSNAFLLKKAEAEDDRSVCSLCERNARH